MEIADQEEELSGSIVSFNGRNNTKIKSIVANIKSVQDLHGQSNPYPAGGGKNKLKVTATTQTVNGVTFTVNDGIITVNGTATTRFDFVIGSYNFELGNVMVLNGCPANGSTSTYFLWVVGYIAYADIGNGNAQNSVQGERSVGIRIEDGTSCKNLVFKPMLRSSAETDPTYAPYENICPISGWTGANIYGRNANIATFSELLPRYGTSSSGVNLTASNGKMTFSGTATASGTKFFGGFPTYAQRVFPVKTGVTYCVSTKNLGDNAWIQGNIENDDGTAVSGWIVVNQSAGDRKYRTFTSAKNGRIAFLPVANLTSGQEFNATIEDIQMTIGTTSVFKGEAVSTIIPINWQTEAGTIYGGTATLNEDGSVDVVSDYVSININGDSYFSLWDDSGRDSQGIYTSMSWWGYDTGYPVPAEAGGLFDYCKTAGVYNNDNVWCANFLFSSGSFNRFEARLPKDVLSTIDTAGVQAYFNAHPLQAVYKVAPTTYHISNIGQFYAYLGTNNIWSDIGDITVKIAEKGITAFELEPHI